MNSYDLIARVYDANIDTTLHALYIEMLERYAGGGDFLEIGCGSAVVAKHATTLYEGVHAFDISPKMLDLAKGRLKHTHAKVFDHSMDTDLPQRYDMIVAAFDVFNHVQNEAEHIGLIKRWANHLTPGGILMFDVLHCAYVEGLDGYFETMSLQGEVLIWRASSNGPCSVRHTFIARPLKATHTETAFPLSSVYSALGEYTVIKTVPLEERTIFIVKK